MEQVPAGVHWAVLVAMSGVLVWLVVRGIDRPQEVLSACLAAGAAIWAGRALWLLRTGDRS